MSTPRDIPSIEQLRQRPALRALERAYGHEAIIRAIRLETAAMRERFADGTAPADVSAAILAAVPGRLRSDHAPSLTPVVNATGVVIHTNLGRSPLGTAAIARVAAVAEGYSNLEYDLDRGERGHRDVHAERLLCRLTEAQAAVVVNNNAAAALLALAALATGREVLISRSELVEIGGGFRIPDVLTQSGARLREVGTTNRTRIGDYAAAIGDRTGMILRVHPSNFQIRGFTERPSLQELVALGRRFHVPVVEDVGSGYLGFGRHLAAFGDEPDVRESIIAGADLVFFSGDKLLGGPQSGILVGTTACVSQLRRHPLMRALRIDKLTCAALEATLGEHLAGRAADTIPVARMITLTAESLDVRASALAAQLIASGIAASVIDGFSTIGGGSAPGTMLPTRLLQITDTRLRAHDLDAALRAGHPPVVARIESDRVVLDLRTVAQKDDEAVATALARAFAQG
jgi:L-seryl-tRNA(Ser) seleniumtransferase